MISGASTIRLAVAVVVLAAWVPMARAFGVMIPLRSSASAASSSSCSSSRLLVGGPGAGGPGWDNSDYLSGLSGGTEDQEKANEDYREFSDRRRAFRERQQERMDSPAGRAFLEQQQQQQQRPPMGGGGGGANPFGGGGGNNPNDRNEILNAPAGSDGGNRMAQMLAAAQRRQQQQAQQGLPQNFGLAPDDFDAEPPEEQQQ